MDPKRMIGTLLATLLYVSQGQSSVARVPLGAPATQSSQAVSQFVVIIDANPSSTRALGFNFLKNCRGCQMELTEGEVIKTAPSLLNYANNPIEAATVIQSLVSEAETVVPARERAEVPVLFEATGLEKLTQEQAVPLLTGARNVVAGSAFNQIESVAQFLNPAREAVLTWASVNYLSDTLYKTPQEMMGLVDLADDVLRVTFPNINDTIDSEDSWVFRVGYHNVKLHTLSLKGLGIESARMGILTQDAEGSTDLYSSCINSMFNGTSFTYNNTEYKLYTTGNSLFYKIFMCQRSISKYVASLNISSGVGVDDIKSFDFVTGPGLYKTVARLGNVGSSSNDDSWKDIVILKTAEECLGFKTPQGPFSCLDLLYLSSLLNPFTNLQLVDKINRRPISFPLGLGFQVAQSLI